MLALLGRVRDEDRTALLMLCHDADAVAALADRVAVLYRGWLAEEGPTRQVLDDPRHPYTWALLNARPTLASVKDLRGIRGAPRTRARPPSASRSPGGAGCSATTASPTP